MLIVIFFLMCSVITFTPQLPLWKTDSIEKLGYGVVNKLFLWFETAFWVEGPEQFGYCTHEEEK